jgi:hypothetical protein
MWANAADAVVPQATQKCGQYRARGVLKAKPYRIEILAGSQSERILTVEGECKTCRYYVDLPVEAVVNLGRKEGGGVTIKSIRGSTESFSQTPSDAWVLKKAGKCR